VEEQEDQEHLMVLEEVLEEGQDIQIVLIYRVVRLLLLVKVMLEVIHFPMVMALQAVAVERVRLEVIR
jgi:hypothetical protein